MRKAKVREEMWGDKIAEMIRRNEGCRHEVYLDTEGTPTCGVGHALHIGSHVPDRVVKSFFQHDMYCTYTSYDRFERKTGLILSEPRKAVIIDMIFQMGYAGMMGFKDMIAALKRGEFSAARDAILDSRYAEQTPERAMRNAEQMESGEWVKP